MSESACFRVQWCCVGVLGSQLACNDTATSMQAHSYAEARAVVGQHCVACHSERPTVAAFPVAPGGVELDTAAQMQKYAERIKVRAVIDQSMPLLNKTGMTESERNVLARWVDSGAALPR